jgi:hypothetical protein
VIQDTQETHAWIVFSHTTNDLCEPKLVQSECKLVNKMIIESNKGTWGLEGTTGNQGLNFVCELMPQSAFPTKKHKNPTKKISLKINSWKKKKSNTLLGVQVCELVCSSSELWL